VNAALVATGSLALAAAGVHGITGQLLVMGSLSVEVLVSSPFGGPVMIRAIIGVTWFLTTVSLLSPAGLARGGRLAHGRRGGAGRRLRPVRHG
jgi:hypothetical protein